MKRSKLAVLIPAYNVKYIDDVLMGLNLQTITDFDVHISDDSDDLVITERLKILEKNGALDRLNVHVYQGPKDFRLNHLQLDKAFSPKYEFVHFHHDDDYIYPTFYEQHLRAHNIGDFAASISKRWVSNHNNIPVGKGISVYYDEGNTSFTTLTLGQIAKLCLPRSINWLGELTNTLFKTNGDTLLSHPPTEKSNLNYYGLIDLGSFLDLAKIKNLVAMESYLSNWRSHPEQTTHQHNLHDGRMMRLAWLAYAVKAHDDQLINDTDFYAAVENQKSMLGERITFDTFCVKPLQLISEQKSLADLKNSFSDWWIEFLDRDKVMIENYFGTSWSRDLS